MKGKSGREYIIEERIKIWSKILEVSQRMKFCAFSKKIPLWLINRRYLKREQLKSYMVTKTGKQNGQTMEGEGGLDMRTVSYQTEK